MTLRANVDGHSGHFLCEEIRNPANRKTVAFGHVASAADGSSVPDVPGLAEFYAAFGSLELYRDHESGESAFYIAPPDQWRDLDEAFHPWIEDMSEEEKADCLPEWIDDRLVVGEIPGTGNYLLVPASGVEAGKAFEFEHDGCEFIELAPSLCEFVLRALDPDPSTLTGMASHMRFVTEESTAQWWIKELRDNRGNVVATEA